MIGGELIHQTSDEHGNIEVVDYMREIRALHFGNQTQQSASLLCNPYFLIHKYAQAMLLPLCWLNPNRVLVLGLGAGSIVKYLYKYHPDITIDTVELRPKVTELAIEFFLLPEPDEHLNIYHDSADSWLKQNNNLKYDLILVDVFLTSPLGKDITVDISNAFSNIYNKLTENGTAIFNHLSNQVSSYTGLKTLSSIFSQPIRFIDIESTNSIILASRGKIPKSLNENRLKTMASLSSLPYQLYFNLMRTI
jgi:spermidine synthase